MGARSDDGELELERALLFRDNLYADNDEPLALAGRDQKVHLPFAGNLGAGGTQPGKMWGGMMRNRTLNCCNAP